MLTCIWPQQVCACREDHLVAEPLQQPPSSRPTSGNSASARQVTNRAMRTASPCRFGGSDGGAAWHAAASAAAGGADRRAPGWTRGPPAPARRSPDGAGACRRRGPPPRATARRCGRAPAGAGGSRTAAPRRPRRTRRRRSRRSRHRPGPDPAAVISCSSPSASRSLAQNTAVGRRPRAARPGPRRPLPGRDVQRGRLDHVQVGLGRRPAARARMAPSRRSATCLMDSGPPTNAIRSWPASAGATPPARRRARRRPTPSTGRADGARLSTRTTGVPRRCSRASRASAPATGVIRMPCTRCSSSSSR